VRGDRRRFSDQAVAECALLAVDLCTGQKVRFACLNGRTRRHLLIDARMHRNTNDLLLQGKRLIPHGDRRLPHPKVDKGDGWNRQNSKNETHQKTSHQGKPLDVM
jgi:hypothetical protein